MLQALSVEALNASYSCRLPHRHLASSSQCFAAPVLELDPGPQKLSPNVLGHLHLHLPSVPVSCLSLFMVSTA